MMVPRRNRWRFPQIRLEGTKKKPAMPHPSRKYPVRIATRVNSTLNHSDKVMVFAARMGPSAVAKMAVSDGMNVMRSRRPERPVERIIRVVGRLWDEDDRNGAARIALQTSDAVACVLRPLWVIEISCRALTGLLASFDRGLSPKVASIGRGEETYQRTWSMTLSSRTSQPHDRDRKEASIRDF